MCMTLYICKILINNAKIETVTSKTKESIKQQHYTMNAVECVTIEFMVIGWMKN